MATTDQIGSANSAATAAGSVDLLIGIAGPVNTDELQSRTAASLSRLVAGGLRVAVASPVATTAEMASLPTQPAPNLQFLSYPLSPASIPPLPWLAVPAAYREIAHLAESTSARVCIILGQDLAALDGETVEALARPVLDGQALLSVPIYVSAKHEGLLNIGVLSPFIRALYGRQIHHPMAVDFALGGAMLSQLATETRRSQNNAVPCPIIDAAVAGMSIAQSHVKVRHERHDSVELSAVLTTLAGAVFEDAERNAAVWQRMRGSHPPTILGSPSAATIDGNEVDVRPLIESFKLGWRNLQEVWGLVLPPVTLLELKRLSLMPVEQFRMPDQVWAKIIYDFALAHRLRSIGRTHLLGALTPLYLAWVASYIGEIQSADATAGEERLDRLAKAYEESKPYFVSRWRWPDRFNP